MVELVPAQNFLLRKNLTKPILQATRAQREKKVKAGSEESEVCHAKAFPKEGDDRFCWLCTGPLFALT